MDRNVSRTAGCGLHNFPKACSGSHEYYNCRLLLMASHIVPAISLAHIMHGRSLPFWKHFYPKLQHFFTQQLSGISVEDFYKGINKIQPSLIRTEADEITYHFHVLIRYELEKKLIDGTLSATDIPHWWNEQYQHYLGLNVPDDRQGCLQDVHWSHGSFGYFPTYSLGSLYAAQLYASLEKAIPGLDNHLANGNTAFILRWLRENVHQYGRYYTADELCNKATGENLNAKHFLSYLQNKYSGIYPL